ncbi:1652_t:CDS:2 [Dentiscutata heterogama]|uniref:1652_t:CDS:1 n=1 Tax=Dentiscutata heterogama TaxID=1316150 RepID=A0ACA9K271_9GLOM|nr:1652_t:CDS:2 [Dentiscutata heterogama]
MSNVESVVVAVVISESTRVRGLRFEVDIVEMVRFVIQCKNWVTTNIGTIMLNHIPIINYYKSKVIFTGRPIVDELLGVLIRTQQPNGTIGIIVAPSMNNFTPGAIDAAVEIAESSAPTYPIIVTGKAQLPKYLINAVLSRLLNRPYTFVLLP